MDFFKPSFIFLFLPITIISHTLVKEKYRNSIALITSLIFYASGSLIYLPIILLSSIINFYLGHFIDTNNKDNKQTGKRNSTLIWGIVFNIALLFLFKLISQYSSINFFSIFSGSYQSSLGNIAVPLGLSYITFQNIAYLVDISNGIISSENKFVNYFLFIIFFPKIITGPIVLYQQVNEQIQHRNLEVEKIAKNARRFIIGLAKKVLIADIIAQTINPSLNLASPDFSSGTAWFLLIGYTIQIYFDFSGYADMALGLAGMMGFSFLENFNFPYIAESITDFWRRWHISLSNWVREYIFIPLEFKRRKSKFFRQQIDFLVTFLLTGLWHGPTTNFIIWGAIHGLAMGVESVFLSKFLKKTWKPLCHIYTLSIVMLGWVFFRPETTSYSIKFLGRLFGLGSPTAILPYNLTAPLPIIDTSVWIAIGLGILFSIPVFSKRKGVPSVAVEKPNLTRISFVIRDVIIMILFLLSIASITSNGYVGSIYGIF